MKNTYRPPQKVAKGPPKLDSQQNVVSSSTTRYTHISNKYNASKTIDQSIRTEAKMVLELI